MNILHLKYAVEVAKHGSLNKAAQTLLIAQPNLSRSVKDLEADLGITIFDRSAKGMLLTPEGQEFIGYAQKILDQIDEVENLYKSGNIGKKRFSVCVPRASYMGEALSAFSNELDGSPVEIYYKETNSWRTVKNVLSSEYKLGILRYAENYDKYYKTMLEEKGLHYELIAEFDYAILMNKDCPLAQKDEITLNDLRGYIEIAHADPFVPNMHLEEVMKSELDANIARRIFVFERASQFEVLSENTEAFMWVSPVTDKVLERFGLVQRKCSGISRIYKDMLVYRKEYTLTDLDKSFITALCDAKRKYL